MKTAKRSGAIVAAALSAASHSSAEERPNIIGFGSAPCRQVQALNFGDKYIRDRFFAWSAGFLSGLNVSLIVEKGLFRDFSSLTLDRALSRVVDYCAENPDALAAKAVETLMPVVSHSVV